MAFGGSAAPSQRAAVDNAASIESLGVTELKTRLDLDDDMQDLPVISHMLDNARSTFGSQGMGLKSSVQ